MALPQDWAKQNSDFAVVQAGSNSVSRAGVALGDKSGKPTLHLWDGLRLRFANSGDPRYIGFWDDLLGDVISTAYIITLEGSGDGTFVPTATTERGGVGIAATSPTSPAADDFIDIAVGLSWLVSAGWTFFTGRIRGVTSELTNIQVEIGLADAVTYTNGVVFNDETIDTPRAGADAVVFGFQEATNDTSFWVGHACNNGTVTLPKTTSAVPYNATDWAKFDIVIDPSGHVWMYINDHLLASYLLGAAVLTTAVLTPFIALRTWTTAQKHTHVDYIGAAGAR